MPKFAAGIVLYNPKQEQLEKNITHIIDQVDRLYLVDNGSDHIEEVRRKYEGDPRVLILSMGENKGIAAALNRMMAEGEAEGFDWVLTLDQDSICESDLLQKYAPYLDFDKVAMITPYVHYVGQADRPADGWPEYEYVHRCITSAALTKVSIWRELGGFDERLFIDMVDYDYCALAREKGFKILRANRAVLEQELGDTATRVTLFNKLSKLPGLGRWKDAQVYVYNHSPGRTYYYARNSRYYLWRYKDILEPDEAGGVKSWILYKLLFEKQKFAKLRAVCRGRRDGKKLIKEGTARRYGEISVSSHRD